MALRRTRTIIRFISPKTLNPFNPYSITNNSHIPENSLFAPHTRVQGSSIYHSSTPEVVHSNRSDVVNQLITIFTMRSFDQNTEELRSFGATLTPEIVEMVLKSLKSWKVALEFFAWAAEHDGYKHNCYTCNAMASILSRARQVAELRILAKDYMNSLCYMTPGALGFFIRCLGSQGLVEEANRLFDQVKKTKFCIVNNYSYNCLLEALAKSSRVELVEFRFKEMIETGWEPDKFTLTPVLQAYCNAGMFEEALRIYNQIHDKGWIDEHVFTILVVSLSKWGEVDKAFELIKTMEDHNMRLNEKTLCTLIHGFTMESRIDKALQLFDKMRVLGLNPDLAIYGALIDGLCKKKELDMALNLYMEMKGIGIISDLSILMRLISLSCEKGEFFTANQLLEEGKEQLDGKTTVLLFNAVLEGLVNNGSVDKAHSLLRVMMGSSSADEFVFDNLFSLKEGIQPNLASFSFVIDGLCKFGKVDVALNLFHDMIQMGYGGSLLLYNNLIHELCNADRLEEGFKLLREMKQSGHEPKQFTHNSLFGCLCRRENTSGALVLIKEMRSCGHEPWIKHSSMLVKQLCGHGKAVEACNFLSDMVREGFLPDIIAYSAAMDGLFKIGEVDKAIELFQDVSKCGYRPDVVAYNIIIRGLCKVGRVVEAQNLVNEMQDNGLLPSVITYNLMIDGLCKSNEINQAFCYFKKMIDEAREPTIITYTTLIDGLCNAGRPDDALLLWNEMREKGCTPNRISYIALIHGLCKCSKADAALIYFHEMKEKEMEPDTFVYVALISNFISKGKLLLAFEILREMTLKWNFPDPSDKNHPVLVDALHKLSEDSSTSSDVKNLIAVGHLPPIL